MRNFQLVRSGDVNGNTGTGVVAYGVQFPWGSVSYCFVPTPEFPQPVFHNAPDIDTVERLHSHEGRTVLVWLDDPGPTVWTLAYWDEDCNIERVVSVIGVYASLQAAIDFVRLDPDFRPQKVYYTSKVEFRIEGRTQFDREFLVILRETEVRS